MLTVLTWVALVLLAVCALLAWAFVARHARTRWWDNAEGRYLMKSKTILALMFTLTLVGQAIPLRPMTGVVLSILLFGWTAYTLGELLHLQTVALREAREHRAKRVAEAAGTLRRDAGE